jgi:hypothetical protein
MAVIVWSVKQFGLYVLGGHLITTDHKSLNWVFKVKTSVRGC